VSSPQSQASAAFGSTDVAVERDFLRQVFAWMFLALALTTGIAIWFHQSDAALNYFASHKDLFYVALFGQLGMVLVLRGVVRSLTVPVSVAAFIFFAYAALTGLVFSILLDVYTTNSVVGALPARRACSAAWRWSATRPRPTSPAFAASSSGR
jgi:FtsH-binding integral membrane protein